MKKDFNIMNDLKNSALMVEATAIKPKQERAKKVNPLSQKISLNLTKDEYEKIKMASEKEFMTLSNFVRKILYDANVL